MSGDSFKFEVQGNSGQVNQAQTINNPVQNVSSGGAVTVEQFFASLREQVAAGYPEVIATSAQEVAPPDDVIKPLEEMATKGEPVEESTLTRYLNMLRPHGMFLVRCVAAFSEPALTALASGNPVVAGIIGLANELRKA